VSKVVLVTGAGRGLGTDIVREALAAGHRVAATGRDPARVLRAVGGDQDGLLVTPLDITDPDDARAAAAAAVEAFGRIDVLVNSAATFQAGYFEEISQEQMRRQIETNLFGPMNVTRAVLPVMRRQRAGHVMTLSSVAGLVGQEFCVAYSASKFGVEGWMEALRFDVEPYGIHTTVVEPGFFRTELPFDASTSWAELSLDDYAERTRLTRAQWESMNGQQAGDPAKLARALLRLAGADAIPTAEAKGRELVEQARASRSLGLDLAYDNAL